MKTKLLCLLFLFICTFCLGKDAQVVDTNLAKPSYGKIIENPDMLSYQLKTLRDRGELTVFYDKAKQLLKSFEVNRQETEYLDAEKKKDILWCCYLIANTPLVQLKDYPLSEWCTQTRDLDYMIKERVLGVLGSFHSSHFFPNDKGIEALRSAYCACIMLDFKRQIDSSSLDAPSEKLTREMDLEREQKIQAVVNPKLDLLPVPEGKNPMSSEENQERAKKWHEEVYSQYRNIEDEYIIRKNIVQRQAFRNRTAARLVSQKEEDFVSILVHFFPRNKKEVEKYILQSGFSSVEMDDLIDRTVGRDSKTEFLYKGERGRRHDKKIREASVERKY